MESLELLILQELVYNEEYFEKVIPFLRSELFDSYAFRNISHIIQTNFKISNKRTTPELLLVGINKLESRGLTEDQAREIRLGYEKIIARTQPQPIDILISETEKYMRSRLTYQSMLELNKEYGEKRQVDLSEIRKLEDGANFTFTESGFYNYVEEFENRLVEYSHVTKKYPFPLKALNDCTNGGMNSKSLTIAMASTGGGKSIFLCNCASNLLFNGYNVLYITCEMSVSEIAKRIDADLTNTTQDALTTNQVESITLRERMNNELSKHPTMGKLYIKEYPAGSANASILRRDIEEIERLYDTKIDVLVLDYLNLLGTTRYSTKNANTYTLVKAVAEEIRGLGQTFDIPVISATQSNRSALNKETRTDAGLEAVSDSIGLPQTADFMFNIVAPEEIEWKANHYRLFRILKNRWGDPSKEFIKVHLDTRVSRFKDVEGWEVAKEAKPTELMNNFDDRSNGVLPGTKTKNSDKIKEEIEDQEIQNRAAQNGEPLF